MVKWICVQWFKRRKWTFTGHIPKRLNKVILIGGSHTSREDLAIAVATLQLAKFKARILVNREAFKWPQSLFLNSIHQLPYDPSNEKALEVLLVNKFINRKSYAVLLSPSLGIERNNEWNRGFYSAASRLKIPLCMVGIDYQKREVKFHSWFEASGDEERDLTFIRHFLSAVPPKYPEKGISREGEKKEPVKDFLDPR